jgi:hypothetical protein
MSYVEYNGLDLLIAVKNEKYELLELIESGLYLYNLVYPCSPIGSNRVLLLP